MYLALFSVAFGSALTFGQAAILFLVLDINDYISYRAVLNTMNIAAPFFCLGFDTAAPILKKMNPKFPFFWNMIVFHFFASLLLFFIASFLAIDSKILPIILGLAASTCAAGTLIVANYYRVEQKINEYFLSINVKDKIVRTTLILSTAYLIQDIVIWSIFMTVLYFAYVLYVANRTDRKIEIDFTIFKRHILTSIPYIFTALGIIALTRLPFYAAYIFEDSIITAKIDIWLLFSIFILIPMLNKSKIEEAVNGDQIRKYIDTMHASWIGIRNQEILVITLINTSAAVAIYFNLLEIKDLYEIIWPLTIGMILIASVPNFVQVICFSGRVYLTVKIAFTLLIIGALSYLPKMEYQNIGIPFLFIFSALLYCSVGILISSYLKIPISLFWRWRDTLLVSLVNSTQVFILIFYYKGIEF
jgi:hypothetical protein